MELNNKMMLMAECNRLPDVDFTYLVTRMRRRFLK